VIYGPGPFARPNFFSGIQNVAWWNTYIANSQAFVFAIQNAYTIIFIGTVFVIIKMLLGRLVNKAGMWVAVVLITGRNILVSVVSRGKVNWRARDEIIMHDDEP